MSGRHDGDKVSARPETVRAEPKAAFLPQKPRSYGDVKSMVVDLIDGAGGAKIVAHRFGLNISMIYAMADPASDKDMSFARVSSLTSPENPVAAEYLAAVAGGVFMPVPRGAGTLVKLTADLAREAGETVSRVIAAVADGEMTADEAPAALEDIDQQLVVLMALRAEVLARRKGGAA